MAIGEHIRESSDIEMSVVMVFCIVEYLQQTDIIKAISLDDKKEMMSSMADNLMEWLSKDWSE
jgi:hypothetical protein